MPPSSATIASAQHATLLAAAVAAAAQAYAPYSGFFVGAALLLEDGSVVTGANVENASYGLTLCAERAAVVRAVAEHGPAMRIAAAAVANRNHAAGPPCGACRQVLAEFMAAEAPVLYPGDGTTMRVSTLEELLPFRFGMAE